MPSESFLKRLGRLLSGGGGPRRKQVAALRKALKTLNRKRKALKNGLADADRRKQVKKLKRKLETNRLHRKKAVALLRRLTGKDAD